MQSHAATASEAGALRFRAVLAAVVLGAMLIVPGRGFADGAPTPSPPVVERAAVESVRNAPAPQEPSGYPRLRASAALRVGLDSAFHGADTTLHISDGITSQFRARVAVAGEVTRWLTVVTSFDGTAKSTAPVTVLDAMVQLRPHDAFQIWLGQHLGPQDRTNLAGPFYTNSWNFALDVQSYPFDQAGRDRGVTVWGALAGGALKYYASVLDVQPGRSAASLRAAGRVAVSLLEPESGYGAVGTYFGARDTLTIGATAQYQNGSGEPRAADGNRALERTFVGFSADLFYEQRVGGLGTLTFDLGYWDFSRTGADYVSNQGSTDTGTGFYGPAPGRSVLGAFSWLAPRKLGPGSVQLSTRLQWGAYVVAPDVQVIDAALSYVVDGFFHRWYLNYRDATRGDVREHSLQLGAQIQVSTSR